MSVINSTVSLVGGATIVAEANRSRRWLCFTNPDASVPIYIGGSTLDGLNGIIIPAGGSFVIQQQHETDHAPGQEWYAYEPGLAGSVHVTTVVEDATT